MAMAMGMERKLNVFYAVGKKFMFRRRTQLFHPSAQGPLAEGLIETPLLPFVLESATVAAAAASSSSALSPEAPTASVALPPEASAPVPLSPEVPVPLLGAFQLRLLRGHCQLPSARIVPFLLLRDRFFFTTVVP